MLVAFATCINCASDAYLLSYLAFASGKLVLVGAGPAWSGVRMTRYGLCYVVSYVFAYLLTYGSSI